MNAVSILWLLIVVNKIIYVATATWLSGNLCWSMPCLNGGSCFGSAYTYLCICPISYSGPLCEKRLGICQENPCGNRGVCIETSLTTFECRCYLDYMGPTCEEHAPKRSPKVWSYLIPSHTRALFNMLKEAYRAKSKQQSSSINHIDEIDFVGLLSNRNLISTTSIPMTTTPADTEFTTQRRELSESEHIIPAHRIQLEKIFPSVTTESISYDHKSQREGSSSISDDLTTLVPNVEVDMTSTSIAEENMETTDIEEFQTTTPNIDYEIEASTNILMSTNVQSLYQTSTINNLAAHNYMTESIITSTVNPMDYSNTDNTLIDYDAFDSSDPIITSTVPTRELTSSIETTTVSQNAQSRLLYTLCRQLLSHILPTTASPIPNTTDSNIPSLSSTTSISNITADKLIYWLSKYLNSTTTISTPTSTVPVSFMGEIRTSSIPLKRIEMDDALDDVNNNDNNNEK